MISDNTFKPAAWDKDDKVRVRITDIKDGCGVDTEIDGVTLPMVRDVTFTANVNDAATVAVTMLARRPIEIDVSAKVTINIIAFEGCEILDVTHHGDNGKRSLVVRRPE